MGCVALTLCSLLILVILIIQGDLEDNLQALMILFSAGYGLLWFVYTAICVDMVITLELMRSFYAKEYRHIVLQFVFYWLGILVRESLYLMTLLRTRSREELG